jgi:hypothetical protein
VHSLSSISGDEVEGSESAILCRILAAVRPSARQPFPPGCYGTLPAILSTTCQSSCRLLSSLLSFLPALCTMRLLGCSRAARYSIRLSVSWSIGFAGGLVEVTNGNWHRRTFDVQDTSKASIRSSAGQDLPALLQVRLPFPAHVHTRRHSRRLVL